LFSHILPFFFCFETGTPHHVGAFVPLEKHLPSARSDSNGAKTSIQTNSKEVTAESKTIFLVVSDRVSPPAWRNPAFGPRPEDIHAETPPLDLEVYGNAATSFERPPSV
jgi:hypothetical protein